MVVANFFHCAESNHSDRLRVMLGDQAVENELVEREPKRTHKWHLNFEGSLLVLGVMTIPTV